MNIISKQSAVLCALSMLALPVTGSVSAQQLPDAADQSQIDIYGAPPSDLSEFEEGPDVDGFITARNGDQVQITSKDGTASVIRISEGTEIKAKRGLFGLGRETLGTDALLTGLPVSVETVQWAGNLVASQIRFDDDDLQTASMIRTGTAQGFAEQTAATEALRGRVGDIDKYNIRSTTNVNFDTGMAALSPQAKADLCAAAAEAEATENALMLVVGYTDSRGSQELNQRLSEKRAARVVNYLQQACSWKPYRMLTPTGMSEADPLASNDTAAGMAQNRRVAVSILVSKSVDGL
ncbi:OmpA family protein [Sphingomonadaceae bacterium]|nr:OmpA family protein [Sphingomonadaceae bacterium]